MEHQQPSEDLDRYTRSSVKEVTHESEAEQSMHSLKRTDQSQVVTNLNLNESQTMYVQPEEQEQEQQVINMSHSRVMPAQEQEVHAGLNMSRSSRIMPV